MTTATTAKNLVLFASKYPKHVKQELLQAVSDIGFKVLPANIGSFVSGERFCELYPQQQELFAENKAEIAGSTVHVVINMPAKPETLFFDAINTVETLKDCGAETVHVIMPFAPFARQDRAFDKRFVSQAAKLLPKHLKAAGADYVTTFDMHSKAAEKFYTDIFGTQNVNFMSALALIHETVQTLVEPEAIVKYGAPDGGDKPNDVAQIKARNLTQLAMGSDCNLTDHMFFITKRHEGINLTKVMKMEGTVDGADAIEIDDMIDTGGTTRKGALKLKEKGAKRVIAPSTHGIFSGNSLDNLTRDTIDGKANPIDHLITSDSIVTVYRKAKRLTDAQQKKVTIFSTTRLVKKALTHAFN